jgi:hypothetical protein
MAWPKVGVVEGAAVACWDKALLGKSGMLASTRAAARERAQGPQAQGPEAQGPEAQGPRGNNGATARDWLLWNFRGAGQYGLPPRLEGRNQTGARDNGIARGAP